MSANPSAHEAARAKPRTLPTREWLLILTVIMFLEYNILAWANEFGDNLNVINQVSFAGTIVSIILAVLAIVYSYLQSFGQQRDSTNIAAQIDLLRGVVEDVRQSEAELATGLARFDDISAKVDSALHVGRRTESHIRKMQARFESLAAVAGDIHAKASIQQSGAILTEQQMEVFISKALPDQLGVYSDYIRAAEENASVLEVLTKYTLVRTSDDNEEGFSIELMRGYVTGIGFMLYDLGILHLGDELEIENINPTFHVAVEAALKARQTARLSESDGGELSSS
jgi:hypothetical protein